MWHSKICISFAPKLVCRRVFFQVNLKSRYRIWVISSWFCRWYQIIYFCFIQCSENLLNMLVKSTWVKSGSAGKHKWFKTSQMADVRICGTESRKRTRKWELNSAESAFCLSMLWNGKDCVECGPVFDVMETALLRLMDRRGSFLKQGGGYKCCSWDEGRFACRNVLLLCVMFSTWEISQVFSNVICNFYYVHRLL